MLGHAAHALNVAAPDSPVMSALSISMQAAGSSTNSPRTRGNSDAAAPDHHGSAQAQRGGDAEPLPYSVLSVLTGHVDAPGPLNTSELPRRSLADASAAATEKARARAQAQLAQGRSPKAAESPSKRAGMTDNTVRRTHHR